MVQLISADICTKEVLFTSCLELQHIFPSLQSYLWRISILCIWVSCKIVHKTLGHTELLKCCRPEVILFLLKMIYLHSRKQWTFLDNYRGTFRWYICFNFGIVFIICLSSSNILVGKSMHVLFLSFYFSLYIFGFFVMVKLVDLLSEGIWTAANPIILNFKLRSS